MFKKLLMLAIFSLSLFAAGPSLVETTTLEKGIVNPLQEFIGTLKFDRKSVLAAQNQGLIKKINFEVGDSVEKNKILVEIDSDLLNAQIKAAYANLKVAQDQEINSAKDYTRYKNLLETKAITQKEYEDALLKKDSSNNNVTALESKYNELKIQKSKKSIKAPYSGVIVEKKVNLGEWVNAGSSLATIVDTSKAEITFNVPLNIFSGLKKGDIYDVTIGDTVLKAKLNAAIPDGDKLTRTFPVIFKVDTSKVFVFEGQEAKVSLSKNGKIDSLILPRDAVIKRFGQNVVFMISKDMTALMIPVQIIGYLDNKVAVSGQGLVAGMDIVSKGNERIFPNSPVKIINKK